MSNFFAALDDSDNEGAKAPAPAATKKSAPKKPTVVEPSVVKDRPRKNDDRNTKGGRGGRAPARDGKRSYDRRSGTGRGRETKKEGGGGHNWGNDKNDAKKAEGPVVEGSEVANTPESEGGEPKVEAVEPVVEEVKVEEPPEEDKTISYDEYLATKATPDNAMFKAISIREPDNEFSGKAAAKKVEEDFLVMGTGKALRKKTGGKKEKQTFVADFKIKALFPGENDRDQGDRKDRGDRKGGRGEGRRDGGRGGGRGGRGGRERNGGRGGGGGGGGRGNTKRGLDTNDASAFPSL